MNDKDIEQLFQTLKADKTICSDFNSDNSWNLIAGRCGFDQTVKPIKYTVRDRIEFYVWQFTHAVVKPLATSFAVVVLLMAGWIGSTNASFDSLPGDNLYPMKLSMEKVQLAVSFDPEQRSRLELEFTSRRLNEMVELTAERNLANPVRVRIAVDRFKDTVSSISNELTNNDSTELAKAVGRKTQVYRSTVKSSATDVPKEVADQVLEVQQLIDTTQEQAVDVIITAHENQDDEETAHELKIAFDQQIGALNIGEDEELNQKLELAQALADEGSYRRAFQLLKEVELLLKISQE